MSPSERRPPARRLGFRFAWLCILYVVSGICVHRCPSVVNPSCLSFLFSSAPAFLIHPSCIRVLSVFHPWLTISYLPKKASPCLDAGNQRLASNYPGQGGSSSALSGQSRSVSPPPARFRPVEPASQPTFSHLRPRLAQIFSDGLGVRPQDSHTPSLPFPGHSAIPILHFQYPSLHPATTGWTSAVHVDLYPNMF